MPNSEHEEVIKLASVVSEANDNEIPALLVRLKYILHRSQQTPQELQDIKELILDYDLLPWCAIVLKYDHSKVKNGFATAVSIVEILSQCCYSISLEKHEEVKDLTLPDAVNSILYLAFVILEQYFENWKQFGSIRYGTHAETIASRLGQFQSIMDSLVNLVTSQSYLARTVLESDNLIRLLIEDNTEMENRQVLVMKLVQRCVRVDSSCVEKLRSASTNHLLDELIFKITSSQSDDLVGLIVKTLLMMIDAYPDLAGKMTMRYKGLKALMTKWLDHGFDYNLKALMEILDAGNLKLAELARRTRAVKVIWAAYQGWKTRARVGKLHKVIPSLQSSFRRKRQENLQAALKERLGFEQRYEAELHRKRQVRLAREKQLQMLEIVPARSVNRHIQKEEEKAAVKIQTIWRGCSQKKRYEKEKLLQKQVNAAIIIQRGIRKFLKRRRNARSSKPNQLSKYPTVPKELREDYQFEIEQKKTISRKKDVPLSEAQAIHDLTQQRLLLYHSNRNERIQFRDPKLDALLTKIHIEEEVLSNLPDLSTATKVDVDNLSSASNAVAVAAEREHYRAMKDFTSQWWQKLAFDTEDSLDPFDAKIAPVYDQEQNDIEEFLRTPGNFDNLFG